MDQYIGRLLDDRYEILEVIGTGGMAVVYKARCHRLNRLVAIKILKDEFSRDEEFRRRFNHEGEAVAMLSHPNIVQVYDVSSSDNANYIVMELIDGITLKQYMEKKGVLNWKETLHFSLQIAKALEHAHSRSIVHRDIKPHNVMVLKNGSVKVTDFGIARVMSKSNTLTKEALGSVHYISPEQAKGGWVDNRSDLYSLSVVMYEMMAGRPPYDGESPVAVAIQHINGGAPMPSTLNPNIPAGLEQIIMKGMALDAKDRYASATEMLKDMDEFRKDPGILFIFPEHGISGETKVLPSASQIAAQTRNTGEISRQPRTTAERVAGAASNAAAARARSTAPQQRPADAPRTRPEQGKTGDLSRVRTPEQQRAPAARATGADAARRTADSHGTAARQSQNPSRKTREEIREEIREEERNRAATIAVVACSAVAIIAIVIFLVALMNGALLNQGNASMNVPKLVGEYYDQLGTIAGLKVEIGDYVHDDTVEKGRIISQNPVFGSVVAENSTIKVVVSMGPEPEVKTLNPMIIGMTRSDAEAYLDRLEMIPIVKEEFNDDYEVGTVFKTSPEVNAELKDGQEVYLYVSKGPMIETADMPNVVGDTEKVAKNKLNQFGFYYVEVDYKESDEPEGKVIDQSVKAGENTDVTTKIVLTVSEGPGKIKMINVMKYQYDDAKELLDDLGFTRIKPEYVESDEPEGKVIAQSVAKGEEVLPDKEIILTVSKGPKPTEAPTEKPTEAPTQPPATPEEEGGSTGGTIPIFSAG